MKRTVVTALIVLCAFLVLTLTPVFACDCCGSKTPAKPSAAKVVSAVCPVMGNKIPDVSKAPKSVYKGKTYYFCCPGCKPKFDKDPEKYIKK
jgi:YHS domain-containing protein